MVVRTRALAMVAPDMTLCRVSPPSRASLAHFLRQHDPPPGRRFPGRGRRMVWVTCSPTHAPILSDPFPPCAPQTEYACPPKLGLAETRLRPQRGGSMSENDLFFLQAWAMPGTAREARAAWRRGVSKPARRNWGTRGQQGGRGRGARGGEEPPARKRPAAASSKPIPSNLPADQSNSDAPRHRAHVPTRPLSEYASPPACRGAGD